MAKFCKNCGRSLKEGEVCTCTQQSGVKSEQQYGDSVMQKRSYTDENQQVYPVYREKENKVPRLLVPIGQTVAGGLLVLLGFITGTFDWSFMSYVAGAGFLLTGICGLVEAKK